MFVYCFLSAKTCITSILNTGQFSNNVLLFFKNTQKDENIVLNRQIIFTHKQALRMLTSLRISFQISNPLLFYCFFNSDSNTVSKFNKSSYDYIILTAYFITIQNGQWLCQ